MNILIYGIFVFFIVVLYIKNKLKNKALKHFNKMVSSLYSTSYAFLFKTILIRKKYNMLCTKYQRLQNWTVGVLEEKLENTYEKRYIDVDYIDKDETMFIIDGITGVSMYATYNELKRNIRDLNTQIDLDGFVTHSDLYKKLNIV